MDELELHIHLLRNDIGLLYCHKLLEFDWTTGTATFDGYWYERPNQVPCFAQMSLCSQNNPPQCEIVEILSKSTGKSTNQYSEIEDDDGEPMRVCFFPTNVITLRFRIVPPTESVFVLTGPSLPPSEASRNTERMPQQLPLQSEQQT